MKKTGLILRLSVYTSLIGLLLIACTKPSMENVVTNLTTPPLQGGVRLTNSKVDSSNFYRPIHSALDTKVAIRLPFVGENTTGPKLIKVTSDNGQFASFTYNAAGQLIDLQRGNTLSDSSPFVYQQVTNTYVNGLISATKLRASFCPSCGSSVELSTNYVVNDLNQFTIIEKRDANPTIMTDRLLFDPISGYLIWREAPWKFSLYGRDSRANVTNYKFVDQISYSNDYNGSVMITAQYDDKPNPYFRTGFIEDGFSPFLSPNNLTDVYERRPDGSMKITQYRYSYRPDGLPATITVKTDAGTAVRSVFVYDR